MYKPATIFNFFLKKALKENENVSAIKLELLTYFSHGWHLAVLNKALIDEPIKAWRHGPVIESIHLHKSTKGLVTKTSLDPELTSQLKEIDRFFLEGVWRHYGLLNELDMIALCHKDNTPWESTYGKSSSAIIIDNNRIKQHYRWLHVTHPDFSDLDDPMSEWSEAG